MASYRHHLLLFRIFLERSKFLVFYNTLIVAFPADYLTGVDLGIEREHITTFFAKETKPNHNQNTLKNNEGR